MRKNLRLLAPFTLMGFLAMAPVTTMAATNTSSGRTSVATSGDTGSAGSEATVPLLTASSTDTLITEPDDGPIPYLNAIKNAKKSIDVEMYLLTDTDLQNALIAAANRGVTVRVILESAPGGSTDDATSAKTALQKGNPNIQVQWAPSRFTFDHAKTIVIDGTTAIFGSANYTDAGVSSNREYDVETTNSDVVNAVESVFQDDWTNTTDDSAARKELILSPGSESDMVAIIDHAKPGEHVYMEEEETPDPAIEQALISQAKAGVSVELLVEGGLSRSDQYEMAQMASKGVKAGTVTTPYIHAKMILSGSDSDQWAELGSENVSANSLDDNREVGAVWNNPYFASSMESSFNKDAKNATWASAQAAMPVSATVLELAENPGKYANDLLQLTGTVEAVSGDTVYIANEQNGKAAGLEVYMGGISTDSIYQGDQISFIGYLSEYEGHYEFDPVTTPTGNGSGTIPNIPSVKTGGVASYQGLLVKVGSTTPTGSKNSWNVNDGSGAVDLVTLDGEALSSVPNNWNGTAIVVKVNNDYDLAPVTLSSSLTPDKSSYTPVQVSAPVVTLKDLAEHHDTYVNTAVQIDGATVTAVTKNNDFIEQGNYGMALYPAQDGLKPGDIINTSGTFEDYGTDTEVSDGSSQVISTGKVLHPIKIAIADAAKNNYNYVTVTGTVTKVSGSNITINDSHGNTLSVYNPSSFPKQPKTGQALTASGIMSNYNGSWELTVTGSSGSGSGTKGSSPTGRKGNTGGKTTSNTRHVAYPGKLIMFGSVGSYVKNVQNKLNASGDHVGAVDGIFGVKTLAGVKAFQKSHGLTVDGIVGPKTWEALFH